MEIRKVNGVPVSAMGLGCWAIGGPFYQPSGSPLGWGEVDDNVSIRALETGLDMGINLIDTADVYGAGHSEQIVEKVMSGKRDQLVIATKFSNFFNSESKIMYGETVEPFYVKRACEASLKRLGTDYIDLYQLHWNDCPSSFISSVISTLDDLVKEGKIRSYGWSTDSVENAQRFLNGAANRAVQFQFNVLDNNTEMVNHIDQHQLAGLCRGPLGMGLLSEKYQQDKLLTGNDIRTVSTDWMPFFKDGKPAPELRRKIAAVRDILMSNNRSLSQGALAWIWAQSDNLIPIPGFRTPEQVTENVLAIEKGALTREQVVEIQQLLSVTQ